VSDQTRSRRDFLRQAGTVAWATPFILTMAAPSAHAQVSCAPAGTQCGTWSSPLDMCVPVGNALVCCGDCQRAAPPQEQFCLCADV
jgi:hypothetical protein